MARDKKEDLHRRLGLFLLAVVLFISLTSSCNIEIAPSTSIATLNNENITVTCRALDCEDIVGLVINQEPEEGGQPVHTDLLSGCTHLHQIGQGTSHSYESNCSGLIDVNANGLFIVCYGQINGSDDLWSTRVKLLVQDTIEDVTGLTVRRFDNNLNISWTPVSAYTGLNVYYNISVNEITDHVVQSTRFTYSLGKLDSCEVSVNISITPFINTTDNILMGKTIQWDDIPTDVPPNNTSLNYTIIMEESGSVHMDFLINSCNCPAIPTNNLTLKNDTYSFSVTVPVVSNSTYLSTASVALSLYMDLEVDVYLHNLVGSTKQNETILIDTNPLVSFTFMNGTPPVVLCNFTNDVIINEYATGCMVFYTDMDEPVQFMRDIDESTVTVNITNISSSGYYNVYVMVLPAPVRFSHSEYISVKPDPSSTVHHSSSHHSSNSTSHHISNSTSHYSSNSTSITPTPTHPTSILPVTSNSSSPSCTPCRCTAEHEFVLTRSEAIFSIFAIVLIFGITMIIFIFIIIIICYKLRNQDGYNLPNSTNDAVEHRENHLPNSTNDAVEHRENHLPNSTNDAVEHRENHLPNSTNDAVEHQENHLPNSTNDAVEHRENHLPNSTNDAVEHRENHLPNSTNAKVGHQENRMEVTAQEEHNTKGTTVLVPPDPDLQKEKDSKRAVSSLASDNEDTQNVQRHEMDEMNSSPLGTVDTENEEGSYTTEGQQEAGTS